MTGTAVYGTVRTVVWEDGGGNPASYPILIGLANSRCCWMKVRFASLLTILNDGYSEYDVNSQCR